MPFGPALHDPRYTVAYLDSASRLMENMPSARYFICECGLEWHTVDPEKCPVCGSREITPARRR